MEISWPVSYADTDKRCSAYEVLLPEQIAEYEQIAAEYLWNWTQRAFGTMQVSIRPCRGTTMRTSTFWGWRVGEAVPWSCGVCSSECLCSPGGWSYRLPSHAVEVLTVWLDGIEFGDWRLSPDGYNLIRTDGGLWPRSQNLRQYITEEDTWEVTYLAGRTVPLGGQKAAGTLACELAKMDVEDNTCRLPRRFQAITRQGVTVAALDTFEDLEQGHTGIWSIDAWVTSVTRPKQRSRVYSPDLPPFRR